MEDFEQSVENGDPQIYIKEGSWGKWKIFINHNFVLGAELPAGRNDKYARIVCFSNDMPGSLEARTESSEACDTIGKAIQRSSHEGRSTGNIDPKKSMTVIQSIPLSCSQYFLNLPLLETAWRQNISHYKEVFNRMSPVDFT